MSTKNDANKQTQSADLLKPAMHAPVNKLPTGNLAPASTNKQPVLLKNVSEKVAKVFGSDDEDDVIKIFHATVNPFRQHYLII